MLLAKCCQKTIKNIVRVNVPKMKFDKILNMHFRENDELFVRDDLGKCDLGDWVLIKPVEIKKNINIDYEVIKYVYKHGDYIDPLTNKKTYGYLLKEDYDSYKLKK